MYAVEHRSTSRSFRLSRTAPRRAPASAVVTISPAMARLASVLARPATAVSLVAAPHLSYDVDGYYLSERTDFPL